MHPSGSTRPEGPPHPSDPGTTCLPDDDGAPVSQVLRDIADTLQATGFAGLAPPVPAPDRAWSAPIQDLLDAYRRAHRTLAGQVAALAADLVRVADAVDASAREIRAADDESVAAIARVGVGGGDLR